METASNDPAHTGSNSAHIPPIDAAIRYAEGGWVVFPLHTPRGSGCSCGSNGDCKVGKHPRLPNWQRETFSNRATQLWTQWPDANIGMRLDGLLVLDVDPRNGGFESLGELEAQHGMLAPRALQRSGSGGWHYLFHAVDGVPTARGFRPGLDLLTGPGCYIVAEPSLHASGGRYKWTEEPHPLTSARDTIALTTPPQWLLDAATQRKPKPETRNPGPDAERVPVERIIAMAVTKIQEGAGRNDTGLWLFTSLRDNGYSRDESTLTLRDWVTAANTATPGQDKYTMREAEATLRSAYSRPARDPWQQQTGDGLTQELTEAIKQAGASFARDAGGRLYYFEDGVYRPTGERFVQQRVKHLCQQWGKTKGWSPELATRVHEWIVVDARELWERPPIDVVNCRNGLLELQTRTLLPHSPDHLSPVQIAASYDPAATCPHIERFVRDVFPADTQGLPWEVAGWLMRADTSIQKAILTLGEGANGKSVWLSLIEAFLGRENVSTLTLHKIESDKFAAARLVGKLVNIGTDLPTTAVAGTSVFKALTGGDTITAERKFESSFEFRPFVRLLFSANSAPRSDDATHGFFRRWLVIPFNRTFDETDPDHVPRAVLDARLTAAAELSGMLNKALDALAVVQAGHFTQSPSTKAALEEFRQTTDPLGVWLDQNTVERADGMVAKDQLRRAYGQVCQDHGRPIMGDVHFTAALKRLRPKVIASRRRVDGRQTQVFEGLGLRTQESPPSGLFE